ncbi:MAG: hypothetical protein AB7L65_02480, partial [Hyphomonadaceae bacterium]
GIAQLSGLTIGSGLLLALAALWTAFAIGKPPRQRRHVMIYVLVGCAFTALLAPVAFVSLLGWMTGVERGVEGEGMAAAGLSPDMAWTLAPLAMLVSAPSALFAGLTLAVLGFRKPKPRPQEPASAPGGDLVIARRTPELDPPPIRMPR